MGQTLDQVPRLNDEIIASKIVPDVQQVEVAQTLAQVPHLNDEIIGPKMESVPDVQYEVEVNQILAQVHHVNDEVLGHESVD